jgi:hypothetical protein
MNKEQEVIALLEKAIIELRDFNANLKPVDDKICQAIAILKQPSHRRLGPMSIYPKPVNSPPTPKEKTTLTIEPETGVKEGEVASQPPASKFTKELRALLDIPDDKSCKDESYRKDLEDVVRFTCGCLDTQSEQIKELEAVYDHPNHDDPKQRYLYEIRCAIKLLRENGSEYAVGVAVQLDQFYKRAREALKVKDDNNEQNTMD